MPFGKLPKVFSIHAIGMISSLGPDRKTACAAARAGLTRVRDLPTPVYDPQLREEVYVSGHTAWMLTEGFSEIGLWVRLGGLAFDDLLRDAKCTPDELAKLPWVLCVNSGYHRELARRQAEAQEAGSGGIPPEALRPWIAKSLLPKILATKGVKVQNHAELWFGDEAGFAAALLRAREILAAGASKVVVGVIDATTDPVELNAFHRLGLLKTPENPVGCMPGEAAVLMVLESDRRPGLATISAVEQSHEAVSRFSDDKASGIGYAKAIEQCFSRSRALPKSIYVDQNGDAVRAFDWGTALLRIPESLRELPQYLPIASFGTVRASFAAISMAQCVHLYERDLDAAASALIVCGSDDGARAAILVEPCRRVL